jgi:streptogramin lyase
MIPRVRRLTIAVSALILSLTPLVLAPTATASAIVNQYPMTGGGAPQSITSGPDGALWVGVYGASCSGCSAESYIYRVTTSGNMTSYQVTSGSDVSGTYDQINRITTGPDGALWFTLGGSASHSFISRITTSGNLTKYTLSTNSNPIPLGITTGPDGNLWFTNYEWSSIYSISPTGTFGTYYPLPSGVHFPRNIVTSPDGALWFTVDGNNDIYRVTTSGDFTGFPISSAAFDITTGPDGALWFTESFGNKVGRITTSGDVTEYAVPTSASSPNGITSGPDGALWFTENAGNKLGRITTSGSITEYSLPAAATNPGGITTGSDGDLWFTDNNGVGQLNPIITIPSVPVLTASSPVQYPYLSWDSVPGADSYNIYRNGSLIDTITTSSTTFYTDYLAPEGNNSYYVTAVNTAGESGPSNTVSVLVDRTAPVLGIPSWTNNPMTTTQTASVSVPVTDNLSGVAYGEYYLGTTDPGQGSGTPMTLSNNNLTASFSGLTAGIYTVNFRAEDNAGNWSPVTTDYLSVYDSTPQGLFSAGDRFTSPAGAFPQNASLTGNVTFGLVYKYRGTIATGDRQFTMNFKAANLMFNATTVSTLVISNGMATLTGTGTINGSGSYNFLVTGTNGGGIRIQITDPSNNNNVIYDTQPGAPITAIPTTSVNGQVIVNG